MIFWKCEPWRFTRLKIYKMGCAGNQKTQSSRSTLNTPSIQKKTQSMNDKSLWIRVKNSINEIIYSLNENRRWKRQRSITVGTASAAPTEVIGWVVSTQTGCPNFCFCWGTPSACTVRLSLIPGGARFARTLGYWEIDPFRVILMITFRWKSELSLRFWIVLFSGICNPRGNNCGYSICAGRLVDSKSTGKGNDDDNANY